MAIATDVTTNVSSKTHFVDFVHFYSSCNGTFTTSVSILRNIALLESFAIDSLVLFEVVVVSVIISDGGGTGSKSIDLITVSSSSSCCN